MNKRHLIIAEVGSVHDGSFGNACELIKAAINCGADAVKFQTHIPEAETSPDAPSPPYFTSEPRFEYFKRTAFTREQWLMLRKLTESLGAIFLSSPFSIEAVDFLEEINIPMYKVPSGEITNHPLLERLAKTRKPVFLSSGMSNWDELDQAQAILKPSCPYLVLMQCSSIYPCPPEKVGMNILVEMQKRFGLPVGFSDHTLGYSASIAAAALGAEVIEKHFTFSRLMYGSDAAHSLEPAEFKILCKEVKDTWKMMDSPVDKDNLSPFMQMKMIFEKSIFLGSPVKAGSTIRKEHLTFKKPGDGISAALYTSVLGLKAKTDLPSGHKLRKEDLTE